jgi:hypothetical protein
MITKARKKMKNESACWKYRSHIACTTGKLHVAANRDWNCKKKYSSLSETNSHYLEKFWAGH